MTSPIVAASAPAGTVPVGAISALSFAAFASASSLRVADPAITRIAGEFGLTLSAAAQAITAYSLAYGVLQLVFGPTGDRFGKVRVIGWACAASTVTALLSAWSPNFGTLLLARALSGAAGAAMIPLSMAWIGDVVAYERRQPVLARFLTGQILGVASGGFIGGFAADHFGWRVAYLFIAAWFAAAGLLLRRVQRHMPTPVLVPPSADHGAIASMLSNMRIVAAGRWPRVILAIVFLEGVTLFGAFAFVPTHMHARYGVSLTLAGSLTTMFGVGGLAFAIGSRRLLGRLGEARLAGVGATLLGVALVIVGVSPSPWPAVPCMAIAGLGFYMVHNTLQTQATQMAPERRGAAVSLFAFAYFMGQSLGVALAGYLLAFTSPGAIVAIGGAAVMLVGLRFAALRARWSAPLVPPPAAGAR